MKKLFLASVCVAAFAGSAEARKMSTMEWMDPKGFEIWQSLSAAEKAESVSDMFAQSAPGREPDKKQFMVTKATACIDREVADPDYKGVVVPLYIPWTYCMTKYTAIVDNKQ